MIELFHQICPSLNVSHAQNKFSYLQFAQVIVCNKYSQIFSLSISAEILQEVLLEHFIKMNIIWIILIQSKNHHINLLCI